LKMWALFNIYAYKSKFNDLIKNYLAAILISSN